MVTLINKSGKMKVYNLDHPFFRTRKWGARRMNVTVMEESRDGRRLPRILKRSLPGTLTLCAGESRSGLPPQIQAVPAVRKDIRKGRLLVVKEEPVKAKPKPKVVVKAAPEKKQPKKG